MTVSPSEPPDRKAYPDTNQDARVTEHGRSYQAARDQHITEYHYHSGQDSSFLDFAFEQREVGSAQDTVTRVQDSIRLHRGLIDFLYQMLNNVQQAVGSLTVERDALREELRAQTNADAELQETRARLDDTKRRLEEAERVQNETIRRLNHVQRQRAEAERLKAEAVEQLRRIQARLADLQQHAPISADSQVEEAKESANDATSLMGEADQQVASDVLHRIDVVLEQEAANLTDLRGIVAEGEVSDNVESSDSPSSPIDQLDDTTSNITNATPNFNSDDLKGNVSPLTEAATPGGDEMEETAERPNNTVTSKRHRYSPRQAMLLVERIEPWPVMSITGIIALSIGITYVLLSFSDILNFTAQLFTDSSKVGWMLCFMAFAPPLLVGILVVIYNLVTIYDTTAGRSLFGIIVTLGETDALPTDNRRAYLRIGRIYVRGAVAIAWVGGLVCGGIYGLLELSGARHSIVLFTDRSLLGRIAVTVGAIVAFAVIGGLITHVQNIIGHIKLDLAELPENSAGRRAKLEVARIGSGGIMRILTLIALIIGTGYIILYNAGVLHWSYLLAQRDPIYRFLVTAAVIIMVTLIIGIGTLVNNVCASAFKGVSIVLRETD